MLQDEFPETFLYIDNHTSGQFSSQYSQDRRNVYGNVGGVPDVRIDGKYQSVGGGDGCYSRYQAYRQRYITRMNETGSNSPVSIEGDFIVGETTITITATYKLLDPVSLPPVRGSIILYEDDVYYNPSTRFDAITRFTYNQTVSLSSVGQTQVLEVTFNLDPAWNPEELHAIAILQETTGATGVRPVVQGARMGLSRDYGVTFDRPLASVPAGNGSAFFQGVIENLSDTPDQLTIEISQDFGWPADIQIAGDPNWSTSQVINLDPDETAEFTVRVQTDGDKRVGTGEFAAVSANTGRNQYTDLRVFNGSPAILFVDDDRLRQDEVPYLNALDDLGFLYDQWRCEDNEFLGPPLDRMIGFDVIIWQNGFTTIDLLSEAERASLMAFIDWGGNLYFSSLDYLTSASLGTFESQYLGLASWTVNVPASVVDGVAGDPITSGISMDLTWPHSSLNRPDIVLPGSTASTILRNQDGQSVAIRNQLPSGARTVFSTIPHNTMSENDPDPDNCHYLLLKVITWLIDTDVASTPDGREPASARALWAGPNPWTPQTELRFRIDDAAPVRLAVVDVSGRVVRTLRNGVVEAGLHREQWDGLDEAGRAVPSGIYFVRLDGGALQASTRLVVLR